MYLNNIFISAVTRQQKRVLDYFKVKSLVINIKKEPHVEALAGLAVARPGQIRRNTIAVHEEAEWEQVVGISVQLTEEAPHVQNHPVRIVARRHTTAMERFDLGASPFASVSATSENENQADVSNDNSLPASNELAEWVVDNKSQNEAGGDTPPLLQTKSDNSSDLMAEKTSTAFDMGEIASAIENLQPDKQQRR